jgi:hypothetical protein
VGIRKTIAKFARLPSWNTHPIFSRPISGSAYSRETYAKRAT